VRQAPVLLGGGSPGGVVLSERPVNDVRVDVIEQQRAVVTLEDVTSAY